MYVYLNGTCSLSNGSEVVGAIITAIAMLENVFFLLAMVIHRHKLKRQLVSQYIASSLIANFLASLYAFYYNLHYALWKDDIIYVDGYGWVFFECKFTFICTRDCFTEQQDFGSRQQSACVENGGPNHAHARKNRDIGAYPKDNRVWSYYYKYNKVKFLVQF